MISKEEFIILEKVFNCQEVESSLLTILEDKLLIFYDLDDDQYHITSLGELELEEYSDKNLSTTSRLKP
jgi:hypothetical protein